MAFKEGTEDRRAEIRQILAKRGDCTCDIDLDATDNELMFKVKSCTPGWQCSTLDYIRRRVVNYNRHRKP